MILVVSMSTERKIIERCTMCKCKIKKPCPDEMLSEFCVKCGRIWINTMCGHVQSTDRYHPIQKTLGGVWIGHTFIKDKTGRLSSVVRRIKHSRVY